ncbi:MAG: LacI family DNA-binding transcriptional regulator, partial [Candidatus Eremiobacteraeota bacterium]|nr:LacI family DNA-binding transcriptional regulator [Candidatus Eremiobacteraeota bacterium]
MNSITDVARLAGLSVASVSRVLNDSKPVSEEVRDRVLRAAKELHYSIDRRARGLKSRKSGTIGLIVADAENPFFAQIIRSIENVTYESKHDLFLCNSDEDPEREQFHLAAMRAQRIDGIILLSVCASGKWLTPLLHAEIPIVCLDRHLPDVDLDIVIVDNDAGSRLAVNHLIQNGHRRIAIVTAHDATVSVERLASFRATLRENGVSPRADYER